MRLRPLLLLLVCFLWDAAGIRAQENASTLADEEYLRATTAEARQNALAALLSAGEQLRNSGQVVEAARAWNRAGRFQLRLSLPEEAIATYQRTLELLNQVPNLPTRIDSLNGLGKAYSDLSICKNAEPLLQQAITLSDQNNYTAGKAEGLLILSECQNASDHPLAVRTAQESLGLWRSIDHRPGMARAHSAIGDYYMVQNSLVESTQSFETSLTLWREMGVAPEEAEALISLGYIEYRKGAWQASLSFYVQAQKLIDAKAEPFMMGQINAGFAEAFIECGLTEIGLKKYRESLEYYRLTNKPQAEAGIEWGIGRTYYLLGNYEEALATLSGARTHAQSIGQLFFVAMCDDFLGRTYFAMNDHAAALSHFRAAFEGFKKVKNPRGIARILALIGHVYQQQGNLKNARTQYEKALTSFRGLADQVNESSTLYALGSLELKQNNLNEAEEYLRDSIQITEKVRRVSTSIDLTTAFSDQVYDRYEKYIDCLMRKHRSLPMEGFEVKAFETSELARARSLTELLGATKTTFFPGLDPQLASKEQQLRQSLQINENAKIALLSGKYKREELEGLESARELLEKEHQQLMEVIREKDPSYDRIIRPRAWTLPEIQEQVIADDHTLLLEYSLGSDKSYVWAVTRSNIASYELPAESQIAETVGKVYKLLASPPDVGTALELNRTASDLSRMILSPVAAELNKSRIIVVADGALNYIPFQILPAPASNEPLLTNHEVINEPSGSILGELQQEAARRLPATKVLAAFGDPILASPVPQRNQSDETEQFVAMHQIENARWRTAIRNIELNRETLDPTVVQPLFYAKRELATLRELASVGETLVATGGSATRKRFLSTDLTHFAVLHLATHGIFDSKQPENSGFVLSEINLLGEKENPFVGLREIYALRAPVHLVVLSACQTGLGKDVRGEGLVGLTRGFMYAGASSVVASLWKVDDEATAELMKHFYANMLQQGMTPAAALRAAQNRIRQEPQWQAPYFWASFTLQGEYQHVIKVEPGKGVAAYWKLMTVAAVIMLLAILAMWFWRRRIRRA